MKHDLLLGIGFATILCATPPAPSVDLRGHRPQTLSFEELSLHLEMDLPPGTSSTRSLVEMPTEVVLELRSSSGLSELQVTGPTGRIVFALERPWTASSGVSELSLECEGASLREVLREFPPGDYFVRATTVDGLPVAGIARLHSRFPGLFAVVSPPDGEVVPEGGVTIAWTASRGAARYVLEVEQDESGFALEIALPPEHTSFTVPAEILRPGQAYEYSLTVEGDTDNQLEIEGGFVTPRASRRPGAIAR